jgi:AmmeMemoRadiSam system protein A
VLSAQERAWLLGFARHSIDACLRGEAQPAHGRDGELRTRRGAFVTIRRRADHELRGCIGFVEPIWPLADAVAQAAVAAATRDFRFEPLRLPELPSVVLDISVLHVPTPILPEAVEVGRHGLVIERGMARGLLLPQVPVEHGWDRQTFLEQACRKAGLPPGTWREKGASLLGFEAEVFGEEG